jgi:hypothetical protein
MVVISVMGAVAFYVVLSIHRRTRAFTDSVEAGTSSLGSPGQPTNT